MGLASDVEGAADESAAMWLTDMLRLNKNSRFTVRR